MSREGGKKKIVIVGAGPAGLMLAAHLNPDFFEVHLYERNSAAGRKFLVAGDGGLNLTHSEDAGIFLSRYTPSGFMDKAFRHFSNSDLVAWFSSIGVPTYIGSSGRVFPERTIKPIEVLNKILGQVEAKGVSIHYKCEWKGWSGGRGLFFSTEEGGQIVESDLTVFALGGSSWPVTGSTGSWLSLFAEKEIPTLPFEASNCTIRTGWPGDFISKYEGAPLKNIVLRCGEFENEGEVIVTKSGFEGSGVYPLSPAIRAALQAQGSASVSLDLKPTFTEAEIGKKLRGGRGRNTSERLRDDLNLSHAQLALLKCFSTKADFTDVDRLIPRIKNLVIPVTGLGPIEDAISTVGGITREAIDDRFMLKKAPGIYVIGEMLDYDAPTGGYLLQSCFSMGNYLSHLLNSTYSFVDEK